MSDINHSKYDIKSAVVRRISQKCADACVSGVSTRHCAPAVTIENLLTRGDEMEFWRAVYHAGVGMTQIASYSTDDPIGYHADSIVKYAIAVISDGRGSHAN